MIRNAAETDVPIMPPILLKASNLSLIAEDVPATTIEVTITILYQQSSVRTSRARKILLCLDTERHGRLGRELDYHTWNGLKRRMSLQ